MPPSAPSVSDQPSANVAAWQRSARLCEALMGGTDAMRAAGTEFLPQFDEEGPASYAARRGSSFLFDAFELTVRSTMAGRIFSQPAKLLDVDSETQMWEDDWDLEGCSLTDFAREGFTAALTSGIVVMLASYPTGVAGFRKDQEALFKVRPYGQLIYLSQLRSFDEETIVGVRRISRLRWLVEETEVDENDVETCYEVLRKITPGRLDANDGDPSAYATMRWWKRKKGAKGKDGSFEEQPSVSLKPHRNVPAVAYSPLKSRRPPLRSLAEKNEEHWQSSSDQRVILHAARVPLLFGSGIDDKTAKKLTAIGAGFFLSVPDPSATLNYVEHGGASIGAGWQDLDRLKDEMAVLAMRPMVDRPTGEETATAELISASQADTQIKAWVAAFGQALTNLVHIQQAWRSLKARGTVQLNTDLGLSAQDRQDLDMLMALREKSNPDISRQTLLERLEETNVMPEGWTAEEELARLDDEGPDLPAPPPGFGEEEIGEEMIDHPAGETGQTPGMMQPRRGRKGKPPAAEGAVQ